MLCIYGSKWHMLHRRVGMISRFKCSFNHSCFFDRLAEANKTNKPLNIRTVLLSLSYDDINTMVDNSFSAFVDSICKKSSENSGEDKLIPWQHSRHSLPNCDYMTLLDSASKSRSASLLNELIKKTYCSPMAASKIGIVHLFNLYVPLVLSQNDIDDAPHNNCSDPLYVLGNHLSNWFFHMDTSSRQKQLETLEYLARFYFSESPTLVQDLYAYIVFSLSGIQPMVHVGNYVKLPSSSMQGTLSSVQATAPLECDDDESSEQLLGSLFILTGCKQLHSMGYIKKSAEFLRTYIDSGLLSPHLVDFSLFGSIVCQAVPLYSELFSHNESVAISVPDLEGGCGGGSVNELLDELYAMHASSSSPSHLLLRSLFYKSLIDCERPSTVIHYDSLRQQAKLELNRHGHNLVMKAHCAVFDAEGLLSHLRQWTRASRPLGAATSEVALSSSARVSGHKSEGVVSKTNYVTALAPPDRRTYASVINFFVCNKQLLTVSFLEELFENMQDDGFEPSDFHLLALFSFAQTLKAPTLANTMLQWYCQDVSHAKRFALY